MPSGDRGIEDVQIEVFVEPSEVLIRVLAAVLQLNDFPRGENEPPSLRPRLKELLQLLAQLGVVPFGVEHEGEAVP